MAVSVVLERVMQLPCPLRCSFSGVLLLGALGLDAFGGFGGREIAEFVGFGPSQGGPVSGLARGAPDLHRNGGYWVNVWAYVLARGLWGGVLTH